MPPSVPELYDRLKGRGPETDEVIQKRMLRAYEESQGIEQYDYILVNDDIDSCVEKESSDNWRYREVYKHCILAVGLLLT